MFDGPRAARVEELPLIERLVDAVFMEGRAGAMVRMFPQYFHEDNIRGHFVYAAEDGRIVSHAGFLCRWACIEGCTVRMAGLGAVGTDKEHRGKGMAGELFRLARDQARADGVDFMMISGDRTLYRRAGAVRVGCDFVATVDRAAAAACRRAGVRVAKVRDSECAECIEWHQRRPVRYLRPSDDWRLLYTSERAATDKIRFLAVHDEDRLRGYLVVACPNAKGRSEVVEFAGDDGALAAALEPALDICQADTLELRLQQGDRTLRALLTERGAVFKPVAANGNVVILDFPQFMARLRPLFEARAGSAAARALRFFEHDGRFIFDAPGERFEVGLDDLSPTVFGHFERPPAPGLWGRLLPVPTLDYGINYV